MMLLISFIFLCENFNVHSFSCAYLHRPRFLSPRISMLANLCCNSSNMESGPRGRAMPGRAAPGERDARGAGCAGGRRPGSGTPGERDAGRRGARAGGPPSSLKRSVARPICRPGSLGDGDARAAGCAGSGPRGRATAGEGGARGARRQGRATPGNGPPGRATPEEHGGGRRPGSETPGEGVARRVGHAGGRCRGGRRPGSGMRGERAEREGDAQGS
jgi:hypothetical protein